MDATSTVIGIEVFGYYEKHVLPAYLIELTGTAFVMYPLKLAIFFLVVWLLDKGLEKAMESESEKEKEQVGQVKNAIKFVIIILGLAPAIRNSIRLFFGI
jgi:Predicted membrane protein